MRHTIALSAILAAIWLLNSGHYSPLLLALGAGSVVFVVYLSHRMDLIDREAQPLHLALRIGHYHLWLFREVVRSNIDVVYRIWRGPRSIHPCMAALPITQQTDLGRVIHANSITLTPGTIAVVVRADRITIHSLTRENVDALASGEMDRRVTALERGREKPGLHSR